VSILRRIARLILTMIATVLLGTLVTGLLVRLAPGFDVDARQLDSRLAHESKEALRDQRLKNADIMHFCIAYLGAAATGDFGESLTLNRPVRELIVERFPTTLRIVGLGLVGGWLLAVTFAFSSVLLHRAAYDAATATISGALLCVPSAVMALLFVLFRAPAQLAIALIVFPRLFRYARNVLESSYSMPHIITARAKGLGMVRVLCWHVIPVSAAPLLALAGVSVSVALGAAVPVEALCGIPGIGQLAWQAAMGRDLPLLITSTVLVTLVTLTANAISDLVTCSLSSSRV